MNKNGNITHFSTNSGGNASCIGLVIVSSIHVCRYRLSILAEISSCFIADLWRRSRLFDLKKNPLLRSTKSISYIIAPSLLYIQFINRDQVLRHNTTYDNSPLPPALYNLYSFKLHIFAYHHKAIKTSAFVLCTKSGCIFVSTFSTWLIH